MTLSDKRKDELLMAALQFIGSAGALNDFQEFLDESEIRRVSEQEQIHWGIEYMDDSNLWED